MHNTDPYIYNKSRHCSRIWIVNTISSIRERAALRNQPMKEEVIALPTLIVTSYEARRHCSNIQVLTNIP